MPFTLIALVAPSLAVGTPGLAVPWANAQPLTTQALAAISGGAAPTTRLSRFTSELAATQGQLVSENLRAGLDVWFADNNVQRAVNESILR